MSMSARVKAATQASARHRASRHFDEVCQFAARECRADYGQSASREWEYSVPVARSKDQTHLEAFDQTQANNVAYFRDLARRADIRPPAPVDLDKTPNFEGAIPSVQEIRDAEDRRMLQIFAKHGCGVGA